METEKIKMENTIQRISSINQILTKTHIIHVIPSKTKQETKPKPKPKNKTKTKNKYSNILICSFHKMWKYVTAPIHSKSSNSNSIT